MHDPQPPQPPDDGPAALTATWEHPRGFFPFFAPRHEETSHDFLVAVPRPDLVPKAWRRRRDAVYTVDLP